MTGTILILVLIVTVLLVGGFFLMDRFDRIMTEHDMDRSERFFWNQRKKKMKTKEEKDRPVRRKQGTLTEKKWKL